MSEINECEGCFSYNSQCKELINPTNCPCQKCLIKMVCKRSCPELNNHVDLRGYRESIAKAIERVGHEKG